MSPSRDNEYTLTLEDVAAIAGWHKRSIHRWTLERREDRGLLPALDTVDGLHFRASDVKEYLHPGSAMEHPKSVASKPLENAVARIVADAPG